MLGAEPQPDLLGGSTMLAQAEQHEAAQRIFLSSLDVACRMGTPLDRARRFACDQAKRATGLDWAAALTTTASSRAAPPPALASAVATFMSAWHSGTLGLPWLPALVIDAHTAFLRWAKREGHPGVSMRVFTPAAVGTRLVRARRTSWRACRKIRAPSSFLVPEGQDAGDQYIADWLGESVSAFRRAAKESKLG
jgi:hypothetical protein